MVDLGKVSERMLELEDNRDREITVEQFLAELLQHDDADALGETMLSEVRRALLLSRGTYRRLGVMPTPQNVALVGFLQGVTFACAYRQLAIEEGAEGVPEGVAPALRFAVELLEAALGGAPVVALTEVDGQGVSVCASDCLERAALADVLRQGADAL